MSEFILMLTLHDKTVPDAMELYEELKHTDCRLYGFKDVGLPTEKLRELAAAMRANNHKVFLEVVSATEEDEMRSIQAAIDIGVDYVIGGKAIEKAKPLLAEAGIKYFPYVGEIVGHPCVLRGTLESIVEDARRVEAMGVDGINLLAYRWDGDVNRLMDEIVRAVSVPVICAGSIDRLERVRAVAERGIWAFTIGGAVLEKKIVPGSLADQVAAVLKAAAGPLSVNA